MNHLDWLIDRRFEMLARRDFDWSIAFSGQASLVAACLWRLLENGRIRFSSSDDGHKFGLPVPVDVVAEVNSRLAGAIVAGIDLHNGTLDLDIQFNTGHIMQLLPDSSGYEAWQLSRENQQFIAVGGGDLVIFGAEPDEAN